MSSRVHLLRFVRDDASKTKPTTVRCRWVYYVRESSRGEISLVDTQQQIRSFPNDSEKTSSFAFARFSSKCREKSPVPPPPPTVVVVVRENDDDDSVVVVVSSNKSARACHQKSVLKSKVPLCFFEVFLFLFLPMFFPPFSRKQKKKKEKKRGMQFRVSNEHTQKKVSLYEDDDEANDIRVEREREGEGRRLTRRAKKGLCCGLGQRRRRFIAKGGGGGGVHSNAFYYNREYLFGGGFSRS